jgi:DNA-binding response OmpR family regulator
MTKPFSMREVLARVRLCCAAASTPEEPSAYPTT